MNIETIENEVYEKSFGKYAIFKNGFFKLNEDGMKIIHNTSELIYSSLGVNNWCHKFICELLDLFSGSSEFNYVLGTYRHQQELPRCWNENAAGVVEWFNKFSNRAWYKLAEKSFDDIVLTIKDNADKL